MRRLTLVLIALLLVAPAATAATKKATGVVRGTVAHGGGAGPVKGASVRLLSALPDGSDRTEHEVKTGANGSFVFKDLPTGRDRRYALEAVYDDGLFVGGSFDLGARVHTETIEVWPTTSDPSVITIVRDEIFVPEAGDEQGAGVIEAVTVENTGDKAYIGRGRTLGGESGSGSPTLGFSVPTQAIGQRIDIISSDLDRLYATDAGFGFVATVAIPPGEEITTIFTYGLQQSTGTFDASKRILYPTDELSVYVGDPLQVSSNRLTERGEETVQGQRYNRWTSTRALDAGDLVPIALTVQGDASSGLALGLVVALGVVGLGMVAALILRRRRRTAPQAPSPSKSRDDLLVEIAELDLAHQSGDVSDDEYATRRSELKKEALASRRPERVR